mmetsp:Transcript_125122/g.186938  ORF Transcript_125122/g.186938 Transcript_125122/m.186938 type:complete len:112 (+) Transcript_125122:2-337(+)
MAKAISPAALGLLLAALCTLALSVHLTFKAGHRTVLEDTVLDKAMFAAPNKMCCSAVTWPCCQHETCCDAWAKNGLDKEEEKAMPMQLFEIPESQLHPLRAAPRYVRVVEE